MMSHTSKHFNSHFLILSLSLSFSPIDSCDWESCKRSYEQNTNVTRNITNEQFCSYIAEAESCIEPCSGGNINLQIFKVDLQNTKASRDCPQPTPMPSSTSSSSSTETVNPTPNPCHLPASSGVVSEPKEAEYKPGVHGICKSKQYHALRQCSLFTYSHLERFNGSMGSCILPGSWYLLKHPDVSIEVNGQIQSKPFGLYTGLNKVLQLCTYADIVNSIINLIRKRLYTSIVRHTCLVSYIMDSYLYHYRFL